MRPLIGFLTGLLFGVGLVIGGMTDPAKVLNFLDVAGTWDPSLAFVMGGALITTFIGYRLAWIRDRPLAMPSFQIPRKTDIDTRLLTGSALFGIGWGLGGYCPGPAWTALPLLAPGTLAFIPALLAGLFIGTWIPRLTARTSAA
jgi:hypothetical protein